MHHHLANARCFPLGYRLLDLDESGPSALAYSLVTLEEYNIRKSACKLLTRRAAAECLLGQVHQALQDQRIAINDLYAQGEIELAGKAEKDLHTMETQCR